MLASKSTKKFRVISNQVPEKSTPKYIWIALLVACVMFLMIDVGDYFLAGEWDLARADTTTGTPLDEIKDLPRE